MEDLDNAIWDEPDFEPLDVVTKALYIWSWSNRRCGMSGIYKVSRSAIAQHIGATSEQVQTALQEAETARFLFYSEPWIWVRSRVKRLQPQTPQIATSIARDCKRALNSPFFDRLLAEIESDDLWEWLGSAFEREGLLMVTRPSGDGHPTIEGPSGDGHENGSVEPNENPQSDGQVMVTRPSGDGARKGKGLSSTATKKESGVTRAKSRPVDQGQLPPGYPEDLVPVVDEQILPFLLRLHEERGGRMPTRRGAALATKRAPARCDFGRETTKFEAYYTTGNGAKRTVNDWCATLGNWLDGADATVAPVAQGQRPGAKKLNDLMRRA